MSTKAFSANIVSGNFAVGTGQKGNFNAKNEIGERYFVSKALMKSIGINKDTEFKPFFAIIKSQEVGVRDEVSGAIIQGVKNDREEAISVFKTEEERDLAMISKQLGNIKRQKMVEQKAIEADLTPESLRSVLSASSFI